ncbi:MAG: prepilin peptidase [Pirellulales bacterium]
MWLELPLGVRLVMLFTTGVLLATQINRGIYAFAFDRRFLDPWSKPPKDAPPRKWFDRIPVLGWLAISRESKIHGTGYWIRPLLLELFTGFFFAWYYHWLIGGNTIPTDIPGTLAPGTLHAMYLSHMLLYCFLAIATFIDFDERLIPDNVTVPGFLCGLLLAIFLPNSLLPVPDQVRIGFFNKVQGPIHATFMQITTPYDFPKYATGISGLAISIGLLAIWWFAICPKLVRKGWGFRRYFQILFASFKKFSFNRYYFSLLAGLIAIAVLTWSLGSVQSWQAFFSAVCGMAFGGLLIWLVRVFASAALGKEAMGFGDVTLMCMIGAYVGWQPIIIIFFLAPLIACLFAVFRYLMTGDLELAFGPYLCFGTLIVLINWAGMWDNYSNMLILGWWLPVIFLSLPVLLGLILTVWSWIKWNILFKEQA